MEVLSVIPARCGSKGVLKKNIRDLSGHPLIAWSIAASKESSRITRTLCSTDCREIAEVAEKYGADVPFLRPEEFAADDSRDLDLFIHCLEWLDSNEGYKPDLVVQLRPTSPVRMPGDLDRAIDSLTENLGYDSIRSVCHPFTTPYKMWRINESGSLKQLLELEGNPEPFNSPRQELPETFMQAGVFEIIRPSTILENNSMTGTEILPYILDNNYVIDIDTELAFLKVGLVIDKVDCIKPYL